MASSFGVLDLPIEKLDFQGDRVREGFKVRVADRNGIGPLVSPNSHDSVTGLRLEEPVNN